MARIIVVILSVILIGLITWWFFGKRKVIGVEATIANGKQSASVIVNGGYNPSTIVLKQGVPAKLTFNRKDASSCLEKVVFPNFGINDFLPQNQDHTVEIDTSKAGEYEFACVMNMFHGKVVVK
ncbi:cupredoxin domain-containing protein [Paucilactobacillus nenjiangensis]|uniref:Cupredoxin domain-containing protein n=1 Tax=Paucilactobacillus nenjiangensis TaxID=1296540 RepID=A0A5P1X2B0_9LACO|nr:cupredoxin domain-containing protein [Paucilactobacillus nenjiangensis]QER66468.1 cupredoxin domain-containing protein [Paucilactobacillus nenjiangensis]